MPSTDYELALTSHHHVATVWASPVTGQARRQLRAKASRLYGERRRHGARSRSSVAPPRP
jgi:hypothetical protein